jgi:uncharacterized membrane protein (DUF485 family)
MIIASSNEVVIIERVIVSRLWDNWQFELPKAQLVPDIWKPCTATFSFTAVFSSTPICTIFHRLLFPFLYLSFPLLFGCQKQALSSHYITDSVNINLISELFSHNLGFKVAFRFTKDVNERIIHLSLSH